jgi:hypothetical protein
MAEQIELHFTGRLAPMHQITARTLAHSLSFLQRAVDKAVIYERRGSVKKYSQLNSREYEFADLIVLPFEEGSIRVPLVGQFLAGITSKIRGILDEPYQLAAADLDIESERLINQMPAAINRANIDGQRQTHKELLDDNVQLERDYFEAALLSDINNLISPLRSAITRPEDTISLRLADRETARDYMFDKEISTRFSKITRQKRLGPDTLYEGILLGLEESSIGPFPYSGKFYSVASEREHKLLVFTADDAHALNNFNLTNAALQFIGAPLAVYGAFDSVRGDIVFLKFL